MAMRQNYPAAKIPRAAIGKSLGVPVLFDWGYFHSKQQSFPQELPDELCRRTGVAGILGNCHASGTDILVNLATSMSVAVYPSATPLPIAYFRWRRMNSILAWKKLYQFCEVARELLDPYNIGRVIARPFLGDSATTYARTGNRKDYSVLPPAPTLLDKLTESGGTVISIGKIADIYAHQGVSKELKATGLTALMDTTLAEYAKAGARTLIFTNLVDFDQNYGHRRDPIGYGEALEYFDSRLAELTSVLTPDTVLLMTADHGCDPTWIGTEHTREYVPVLFSGPAVLPKNLGERQTFADMGQTLADFFQLAPLAYGQSFLPLVQSHNE